tara:strand:+ start:2496 stop:2819 length:324 start_codon:yes stop_codon:yes gene_type:complete
MAEDKEPKLPSFFKMAATFTKELAAYAAKGAPNVSAESYIKRLDACNSCPFLIKDTMRCGKCGCLLEQKAKWRTSDCPATPSKWEPEMMMSDDEHKTKPNPEDGDKI